MNSTIKRRLLGLALIVLSFFLALWVDNWYQVGDVISGIKGWVYLNGWLILLPTATGCGLLIWDTKLTQEPWI